MIEDGVFEDVEVILGVYVYLIIFVGLVGICYGVLIVVVDDLELIIIGVFGYGVCFYEVIDVIWIFF